VYCDCQNILVTKQKFIRFSDDMLQCLHGNVSYVFFLIIA